MCTTTRKHTLKDFDCVMICTLLSHALDGNAMKKLCRKYKCGGKQAGIDPNFAFYTLHHECHKAESKVRIALEDMFDRNYTLIIKHIRELSDVNSHSIPSETRQLLEDNPAGMIWGLLTDEREPFQQLGTYLVHSQLLKDKRCSDKLQTAAIQVKENCQLKQFKLKTSDLSTKVRELDKTNQRLTDQNKQLAGQLSEYENTPNKIAALERKVRMLEYELEKTAQPFQKETEMPPASNRITTVEIDGNNECHLNCNSECSQCELDDLKVAVVGGMDRMRPKYNDIVNQLGGSLLYHNGKCGGQRSIGLRSTICDADIVVFITTINSHNALHIAKAECKKSGKKFVVMRETSPNRLKQLITSELQELSYA